ncbi:ribbon-helix-helix domain-containing protein [Siccirubricoccus phaeus]|uniref:ribbon-helix-helix domain-containing protein n=1 Tax=Siccirubricoccus phaeus TaxID=2595053 RepID=UPI0011F1D826|nr:CopG family transcriptional regulator [Siccirubricoccus phaeus]
MGGDTEQDRQGPDRRQFLVVIDAEIIRRTKILAIERGVSASSLVQQALAEFLGRETPVPTQPNA